MAKTVSKVLNKRSGKRPTKRSRKRPTKRSSKKKYVNKKKHTRKKVRKRKHSQKIIKGGSFMKKEDIKIPDDKFKQGICDLCALKGEDFTTLEATLELNTTYLHTVTPLIIEANEFVLCSITDSDVNDELRTIYTTHVRQTFNIKDTFEKNIFTVSIIRGFSNDGVKHYIFFKVNDENIIKEIWHIVKLSTGSSKAVKVFGDSKSTSMDLIVKWIESTLKLKVRHTYKSILIDLVVDLTTIMEIKINKQMIAYATLTEDELKEYPSAWMGVYRVAGAPRTLKIIFTLLLQGKYDELITNKIHTIPSIVLNIKRIIGFLNIRNINLFNIKGKTAIEISNDTVTGEADKVIQVYKFSSNPKALNYMLIHLKKIAGCVLKYIGNPTNPAVIQKKESFVNEFNMMMNFSFIYLTLNTKLPSNESEAIRMTEAFQGVLLLLYKNIVKYNTDTISTTIDTKMKLYHLKEAQPEKRATEKLKTMRRQTRTLGKKKGNAV